MSLKQSTMHPLRRVLNILSESRSDLWALLICATASSALLLVIPVSIQALVNTVSAGIFVQPVVVITILVAIGLLIAGILQIIQLGIVETIQQRVFAQTAFRITERLLGSRWGTAIHTSEPDLANRFFDVLNVMKSLSKILLDGMTAGVQSIIVLCFLGFYNPGLLAVASSLVAIYFIGLLIAGTGALSESLKESKSKYALAGTIQELARCHPIFKIHDASQFVLSKSDNQIDQYIKNRESHFRSLRRQMGWNAMFAVLGNSISLATGASLVLQGNLTLGQFVAAQLLISLLIASFDKVAKNLESFYDLLTGVEKLSAILDLEQIEAPRYVSRLEHSQTGLEIKCSNLIFRYPNADNVLSGVTFELSAGSRVSLVGASGAGKSTIAKVLIGLEQPHSGTVLLDKVHLNDLDPQSVRRSIGLVSSETGLFDGTILENVLVGRDWIRMEDVQWALEQCHLDEAIARLELGLNTQVHSSGRGLSGGEAQRLLIARAIVGHPRLLILDEAFNGLDERICDLIFDNLFAKEKPWTIIDISHQPDAILRADTAMVLVGGQIIESGSPFELSLKLDSEFSRLFPFLSDSLRSGVKHG